MTARMRCRCISRWREAICSRRQTTGGSRARRNWPGRGRDEAPVVGGYSRDHDGQDGERRRRGFGGGRGGGGGRRGGGGGGGGGDTIALSINGSPAELETGFQLAHLLLTEPKIEETAFNHTRPTPASACWRRTQPESGGARLIAQARSRMMTSAHHPPTVEQIDKLTLAGAQARLDKLIAESPIEVTIVGDLPKDRALELVNKYLGSLPTRAKISSNLFAEQRRVARPKGPRVFEKTVDSPTKAATVYSGFYGPMSRTWMIRGRCPWRPECSRCGWSRKSAKRRNWSTASARHPGPPRRSPGSHVLGQRADRSGQGPGPDRQTRVHVQSLRKGRPDRRGRSRRPRSSTPRTGPTQSRNRDVDGSAPEHGPARHDAG